MRKNRNGFKAMCFQGNDKDSKDSKIDSCKSLYKVIYFFGSGLQGDDDQIENSFWPADAIL